MHNKKTFLIISLISFILFIILLLNINNISAVDKLINSDIANMQFPFLVSISKIIGIIFDPTYIIIASVITSIVLFIRKKKQALFFGITMIISGIILYAAKELIGRTRPENALASESLLSFPSGHALVSAVLVFFIIYCLVSKIKSRKKRIILDVLLIIAVLLIGFSRIYLNVHWLSDVLAGWLLGLAVFSGAIAVS